MASQRKQKEEILDSLDTAVDIINKPFKVMRRVFITIIGILFLLGGLGGLLQGDYLFGFFVLLTGLFLIPKTRRYFINKLIEKTRITIEQRQLINTLMLAFGLTAPVIIFIIFAVSGYLTTVTYPYTQEATIETGEVVYANITWDEFEQGFQLSNSTLDSRRDLLNKYQDQWINGTSNIKKKALTLSGDTYVVLVDRSNKFNDAIILYFEEQVTAGKIISFSCYIHEYHWAAQLKNCKEIVNSS